MTNSRVLLWVLVVLACFCFYSNAKADTSQNLINNQNWDGATYGNDPGGCCASVSGSGALYDQGTDTIMFSYGQDILSQTIAINEALKLSGVQVDGYNYAWTWRRISNSGNGGDTLQFDVVVKDSNGNPVESYVYDYSNIGNDDTWYTESGTETFAQSYLDPQSIQLRIIGKDGGFWGGYYGPEVKDVSLTLNYTADPCAGNPLYDPSCSGYAEAYAQQQYDLNCQANPLYDSGCPGYQQAYYNQQCTANPLYDSGCPGYQQAYYDQQCSIDPLYDSGCPGYAQAYFDQQCTADPFYDTSCPGYAQAYFDQQCGLDTLYDSGCPGYAEAYFSQQCSLDTLYDPGCPGYEEYVLTLIPTDTATTEDESHHAETSTPTVTVSDPVAELTQPKLVDDPIVNEILQEPAPIIVASVENTNEISETESSSDVGEQMDSDGDQDSGGREESPEGSASDDSSGGIEPGESTSDDEQSEGDSEQSDEEGEDSKKSSNDKKRELVAKKAAQLADRMSDAASLEAQKAVQAQVMALINYTPGFDTYGITMTGGYYPDAQMYNTEQLPESRRGLRNGLAQQLLHEKMVEMQYQ